MYTISVACYFFMILLSSMNILINGVTIYGTDAVSTRHMIWFKEAMIS